MSNFTPVGLQSERRVVRRHVPALDGLRGFAILLVFLYHYAGGARSSNLLVHVAGVAVQAGWSGVTLFYILSGFLITGILCDSVGRAHWARNFYVRRVLRIFPLYYGTLLILIIAGAWQSALLPTLRLAGVFAIFCQNVPFFASPARVAAPVYHLGSIAVEEQFYLLWPVTLFLARTRKRALLIAFAAFAGSCLFRALIFRNASEPELYMTTLLARGGEVSAGCILALLYRGPYWPRLQRFAPAACVAGFAAFVVTSYVSGSPQMHGIVAWQFGLPAITFCYAALLVEALTPGLVQSLASARWLRWLGRISYGVYIFHILIVHVVNVATVRLTHAHSGSLYEVVRFSVAAVATLPIAWASYRFFERPILRLKRKLSEPEPSSQRLL